MGKNYNRQSLRVACKTPICTQISIVKVNNKIVTTRTGTICVEDISSRGLKFLYNLNLPVSDIIVIEFKLTIEEDINSFDGHIVRKEELTDGIYRYGVQFINYAAENEQFIIKLYNLNEKGRLKSSVFCPCNTMNHIEKYKEKTSRRIYKRYKFNNNFFAKMKVITNINIPDNSQWYPILINNISESGIQFTSDFQLPINNGTLLVFKMFIVKREISIKGYAIWSDTVEEGKCKYGAEFHIPDSLKELISHALNHVVDFSLENGLLRRKCFSEKFNHPETKGEHFEWWA